MTKSMTGYGMASAEFKDQNVTAQIRSLNGRYREIVAHLPSNLFALEEPLKKILSSQISRGKVELRIQIDSPPETILGFGFDEARALQALKTLNDLKNLTKMEEPITLNHLLAVGALNQEPILDLDHGRFTAFVEELTTQALERLVKFRVQEGQELEKDLLTRLTLMEEALERIKNLAKEANQILFQRQTERLLELTKKLIEPERLAQEAAFLADRLDITEEITRFSGHLIAFRQTLADPNPIGRRLEFLLQELSREANTMGAKSQWSPMTNEVLFIKGELEKAREQALNIE
jgi:uncharacterized protein (TIGR00255 family)